MTSDETTRGTTVGLIENFQELNLSNYNDDDVAALNSWAIEAYAELAKQAERVKALEDLEKTIRERASRMRAQSTFVACEIVQCADELAAVLREGKE